MGRRTACKADPAGAPAAWKAAVYHLQISIPIIMAFFFKCNTRSHIDSGMETLFQTEKRKAPDKSPGHFSMPK